MNSRHTIALTVNGERFEREVEGRCLLADFLRDDLGLTGTHIGCEHGVCGACTVLIDGDPVRSCLALAVQAQDRALTTVEGIAGSGDLHPIQRAFMDAHALQCGYCTPGFLVTLYGLLNTKPSASDAELREALDGVLCRCTGYQNILRAARQARDALAAGAEKAS
jgi:aerobic-type carbon monoxide dehydrogenase small subunit (CoxS/CutS family)